MTLLFRNAYFLFELGEVYKSMEISGCGIQSGGQPVACLRTLTHNSLRSLTEPFINFVPGFAPQFESFLPPPPRVFNYLAVKT
jgi:hypothetical protein